MNIIMIINLVAFSVTIGSPDGMYFAEIDYYPGTELYTQQFTLFTGNGNRVYRKNDHPAHTFYICNTGNVFAMNERKLWCFDRIGSVQWQRVLENVNGSGFSSGGEIFYVSAGEGLYVYDCTGMKLHELPAARLFTSTHSGDMIATVSADTAYYYENGALVYAVVLPSPFAWSISFSDDQEDVVIEFKEHTEIIDRTTGNRRSP